MGVHVFVHINATSTFENTKHEKTAAREGSKKRNSLDAHTSAQFQ